MSRTVDSLIGVVGRKENEAITLRVDDGRNLPFTWDSTYAEAGGAWIGDQVEHSMRMISETGFSFPGDPGIWRYPANHVENPAPDDESKGFGFQIHTLELPNPFIDAGCSLQEKLFGLIQLDDDTPGMPTVGLNYYSLDLGGQFLTPVPTNFGVLLQASRLDTASYAISSADWQNSPADPPSPGANWYPEIYGTGPVFNLRNFYAARRWVAGAVGGSGSSEAPKGYPPIDDVTVWLDARSVPVAVGSGVAEWPNYAGRGGHPAQATAGKRPILKNDGPGGLWYLHSDGTRLLVTPNTPTIGAQPFTVFLVIRENAGGSTQEVWAGSGVGGAPLIYKDATSNNDEVHVWAGGSDLVYRRGSAWPSPWMIWSCSFNGATTEIWEQLTVKATGDSSHPGTGGLAGLSLFSNSDESLKAKVDIASVIVAATDDDAQRTAVVQYLNDSLQLGLL